MNFSSSLYTVCLCIANFIQVSSSYDCLPRSVVQEFIWLCEVCELQKPQRNQAPLKPIISSGFMSRGQVY